MYKNKREKVYLYGKLQAYSPSKYIEKRIFAPVLYKYFDSAFPNTNISIIKIITS